MTISVAPAGRPPFTGESAPAFALPCTDGETVRLADLRGERVLLAFFPLAFTSTCTAEMCAFTDDWDAFGSRGVRVLPVSVDSVPTLREYRAKHDIRAHMLSDFHRAASAAYGVLLPEKNYANRAYFLIDGEGVVRWSHVEERAGLRRDNVELLAAIDGLA